ncbi:MAG: helix-turn-helix domain-containing protein [Lewinella sp.]
MEKNKTVPTLEIPNLHQLHFGHAEWSFFKKYHLFHVNRLEDAIGKLSFPLPPHRKTMNDILFITKGKSRRSKGMNEYSFGKNELFILPAFQITAHESMSEDVEGFFFQFSPDVLADQMHLLKHFKFLNFNANPIVRIPEQDIPAVVNIFERMMTLYERGGQEENKSLAMWYTMALFTEINRHTQVEKVDKKNTAALITQQFKDALTQYVYTYRTVQEFAQLLHITPNHLNKCVKKTLNKTAQSLLNEMLVLEAKSLLKYSNLSISEIAENLCKSTPSNFSRFFKKQTGISPRDFASQ